MSHHFDTKLAREDPSLNLCDFYLFDGPSGKTVMAMTVNPDVGLSAPDTLHPEGLRTRPRKPLERPMAKVPFAQHLSLTTPTDYATRRSQRSGRERDRPPL